MPRREREPEHGGGEERRDQELRAERERAEERRRVGPGVLRQRPREVLVARAHEQPHADADEREDGCPTQEAELAVDEERDEPVGALEVAAGEARVG